MPPILIRNLSITGKLGVAALLLVFALGLSASLRHLSEHYQNRDERPGLTRDDIVAAYAGLNAPAPILAVLEGGHPKTNIGDVVVKPEVAAALKKWLAADKTAENYDNIDFSDPTPRDALAAACSQCHSSKADPAKGGKALGMPLENWEQVKKYAFTRKVDRTPDRVKAISMHTHALSLATMAVALAVLGMLSTWPRQLVGGVVGVMGVGLLADIGSWWLTNWYPWAVDLIIGGGAAFTGGASLMLLLTLVELCKPARK